MVLLDGTIAIVALPSIGADLGFSKQDLPWVLSAYALAFGGLLLLGGRAADLLGRRPVFIAGVLVFTAASLLCGPAWSPAAHLAARIVQGAGAAVMTPTARLVWQRSRCRRYFCARAVALTRRRYDPAGALTITGALVLLVYAVVKAPDIGWGDAHTILPLVGSALLVAALTLIESRHHTPLVALRILRWSVSAAVPGRCCAVASAPASVWRAASSEDRGASAATMCERLSAARCR